MIYTDYPERWPQLLQQLYALLTSQVRRFPGQCCTAWALNTQRNTACPWKDEWLLL